MASKICKIVYFDEDSVTDYVQIVAGGTLEKTTELLNSSDLSEEQKADVSAKGGIGGVFKALLGWEASASGEVSAGLALNRNKMVKNIVKNTILTDFLHIIDENENKSASKTTRGAIKKFEGYVISAEKDSLSYMVMVSPYLSMLRSGSSIPAGDFNIAIDKLENALKNAKGYYEFVGTKGKSKVILRFNINSFKNGYTISDLLKMNLSIYAIKVGRTTIDMLNVSKELEMDVSIIPKDNPSYEESNEVEDTSTSYNAFYELFDEGKYVDTNYSVELGQAIFLLTCNFSNENEIKKALGPAMFSRIGCCVEYADLTVEQKQKIVNNWYDSIMASLKDDERVYIETTDIHEWFLKNAERYDNIRILKSKMENAIFEKLTDHFIIMTGSMAEGTQDRV